MRATEGAGIFYPAGKEAQEGAYRPLQLPERKE